jgi:hypothetical protein
MCVDAHDVCVCVCVCVLSCARQCVKSLCTSKIAKISVIEMEEYNQNRIVAGGGWPVGGAGRAVRAGALVMEAHVPRPIFHFSVFDS